MPDFTVHQKALLFALVAAGLIGIGVGTMRSAPSGPGDVVQIVDENDDHKPSSDKPAGVVMVHVAGKVRKPGVYRLPPDSRVIHAIRAAGGCLPNADANSLNLAAEVKDGERVYVPSTRETREAVASGSPIGLTRLTGQTRPTGPTGALRLPPVRTMRSSPSGKFSVPGEGTVNINTADGSELQRLPGVGPVTAQKILDYRRQVGRFTSAEQLTEVKGIGPKKLERMAPFVTL